MLEIAVIELSRVDDQLPRFSGPIASGRSHRHRCSHCGDGRRQQGLEPGHGPFPVSEFAKALACDGGRGNLECSAKGCARRNDPQIIGQKKQWFVGRCHHGKCACRFEMHCWCLRHVEALKGRRLTAQVITRQVCRKSRTQNSEIASVNTTTGEPCIIYSPASRSGCADRSITCFAVKPTRTNLAHRWLSRIIKATTAIASVQSKVAGPPRCPTPLLEQMQIVPTAEL